MTSGIETNFGPRCLRGPANSKGADQPAHSRSLISAFVIHILKRIISSLVTSDFFKFLARFVAEETGLSLDLSETPKTGFVASRLEG